MKLAVIGAGSWGTALAIALQSRFEQLDLWVHEAGSAERMSHARTNDAYMPGFELPDNVNPTSSLHLALQDAETVLGVMPSRFARGLYREMRPSLNPHATVVSATKGLEPQTLLRMSEVAAAELRTNKIAVLSGPSFAKEVARGEPVAIVISSEDQQRGESLQRTLSTTRFRLYANQDPIGVEIGAALKNVIAIAAGVSHGLGFGSNASAALITRGLAEITRLAVAMGGQPQTLAGLAGLGDLVLTATGELSRNRNVGIQLAHGRQIDEILRAMRMVAEGVETAPAAVSLAQRYEVEMPITATVNSLLTGQLEPGQALASLLDRSLKNENL